MPITDEVRDKIDEAADKHGFRVPYDGSNSFYDDTAVKSFQAGGAYGYSLALAELETFKDAYVERNDECNRLKAELEAKDAEIERLKELVEKVDKGWHITFYRATSTMTAREIENFYNEKLPQFKQQHNL